MKEMEEFYNNFLCSLKKTSNNSGNKTNDTIENDTNTTGSKKLKKKLINFLWAIEKDKFTEAMGLWRETENMMAAALLAYACLKKKKKDRADEVGDLKRLKEMSQYYNDNAKDILTECSRAEKKHTKDILVRKRGELNGMSLLEIAQNNKPFIAHDACYSLMNEIFYSPLEIKQKCRLRILVCVLLPFLAPLLLRFRKDIEEATFRNQCMVFTRAPVVTFVINSLANFTFLFYFGYDLMFDISYWTWVDGIVIAYVGSIGIEEIRQICMRPHYWNDSWNSVDMVSLYLFILGKVFTHGTNIPEYGHVFLACSFNGFSIRLLQVFAIVPQIGPFLIMIRRMMYDLIRFIGIILLVMTCYAVSLHVILYPNSNPTWSSFFMAFKKPFWQIFGELVEDELEGDFECEANGTVTNSTAFCPSKLARFLSPLLLGLYLIIVQVLLINLLIAKFTNTVEKVQGKIEKHWRFLRCGLINEYIDRVAISPIASIYHVVMLIRYFAKRLCPSCTKCHMKRQSRHLYCVTFPPREDNGL